jgi:bifunctional DNA-binding transcriptional regulator/antitoxin component of YhaV-PrlF toxin-antitoxin module
MAEIQLILKVDKSGRINIPKYVRQKYKIEGKVVKVIISDA